MAIDRSLVRALLQEQHPDLAHLELTEGGEGWDNRLYRLGDDLVVRLPRRAAAVPLIAHEQRWLPRLSARLPLPISVPHRVGRPGCSFPWPWSVTSWLPGQSARLEPPQDFSEAAVALGQFLCALHQPAPEEAPHNPWRRVALAARTKALREHLQQAEGLVDRQAVLDLWDQAVSTPPWPGPPVWIHGDLHPDNLLVHQGRLSAVIDFGDLAAGDPATDLSVAWMLFPPSARPAFRAAARGEADPVDDATWMRARGWALALGLAYLVSSQDDPALRGLGLATVEAALGDESWS